MRFSEYLDHIMDGLGITNGELAAAMGMSQSYVSRIRGGSREPKVGGPVHRKIYEGLVSVVKQRGDASLQLADVMPASYEEFSEAGTKQLQLSSQFHVRLSALMDALHVTNRELAGALHFDSSLISKYRNGARTPTDMGIYQDLVAFFVGKIAVAGAPDAVLELIGCSGGAEAGAPDVNTAVTAFLLQEHKDSEMVTRLLGALENRPIRTIDRGTLSQMVGLVSLPTKPVTKKKGSKGLRKLVITFLSAVVNLPEPTELKLYSSLNMGWMIEDPQFFETWKSLMFSVLTMGHTITIIHNIARSEEEMFAAIEGWLPLHLSGSINSHYVTPDNSEVFSNTMFIATGHFCIAGNTMSGLEEEAPYYFIQDTEQMAEVEKNFDQLFARSPQLFTTRMAHTYDQALGLLRDVTSLSTTAPTFTVQNRLPLWPIDEAVLTDVLTANNASEEWQAQIIDWLHTIKGLYQEHLKTGELFECFFLPESFGDVPLYIDLPHFSADSPTIEYGRAELLSHLDSIIAIAEEYENYHVAVMDAPKFTNVKLVQNSAKEVFTFSFTPPILMINYAHDAVRQKIITYTTEAMRRNLKTTAELKALRSRLADS